MARRDILVFDIGGTNVRGAVYDPATGTLGPLAAAPDLQLSYPAGERCAFPASGDDGRGGLGRR